MADEVVREMDMAVNNVLARRRQKMHGAPYLSSIVRGTRVRVKPDFNGGFRLL